MIEDLTFGTILGIFIAVVALVLIWHSGESQCQEYHNVADCEWSRTPFTPTIPEAFK